MESRFSIYDRLYLFTLPVAYSRILDIPKMDILAQNLFPGAFLSTRLWKESGCRAIAIIRRTNRHFRSMPQQGNATVSFTLSLSAEIDFNRHQRVLDGP